MAMLMVTKPRDMRRSAFEESATAVARRFGVSAKALRIYERLGLIQPLRSQAGWRVYRQSEIERLAAIVALKQLGLPLKRIALLLSGREDLATALALQEAALEETKASTDEALALVRTARRRIAEHAVLSPDELANLIRRSKMTDFKWTPRMEELAQKHYSPEQLRELRSRPFTPADQARVSAAWQSVFDDIEALGPNADPSGPQALTIGMRAHALTQEFTQGDPALFKAASAMNSDLMRDTASAPMARAIGDQWAFLGKIFGELRRRGEIT